MTNDARKIADEIDLVAEGFARVPVAAVPPRIKWGEDYLAWGSEKKLSYLEKFAEAMNHAADKLQEERNHLGALVERKEQQLNQMQAQMDANNMMLSSEITKMNEERQEWNKAAAAMQAQIRRLEHMDE